MDDFNKPRFEFEERAARDRPYRQRRSRFDEETGKKKRWVLPLALLLIVIAGMGIVWYLSDRGWIGQPGWLKAIFIPVEETIQITLPAALFAGKDIAEVIAGALEEQGVEEFVRGDDGALTYTMTAEVRDGLLEEAVFTLSYYACCKTAIRLL